MSNKNTKDTAKRPYNMRARARRQEDVHRRITLAAVYLHGSVGPAKTTVSDIAKHAGVRRATVYNHFPTDFDLIDACSSHWFGQNPPPDPTKWAEIMNPAERLGQALEAMYAYYDQGREMLEKVLRDTPQVPALQKTLHLKWWPLLESMIDLLAESWLVRESQDHNIAQSGQTPPPPVSISDHDNQGLRASLRVVLDFFTWQTLIDSGLSNEEAARLATSWVRASAH